MARRAVALLLASGLAVAGCAVRRPTVDRVRADAVPAATLDAALHARRDSVRALRAMTRLRYQDPQESLAFRQALVVARPDDLRIEVLSALGTQAVVATRGGTLNAYVRRDAVVYRGPASAANLARYARVPLPVAALVDVVLGTPPVDTSGPADVSVDPLDGTLRLSRTVDNGQQNVWFSTARVPIAAEERGADGQLLWQVRYSAFAEHGGVPVATHVRLEIGPWSQVMELELEDVDLNPVLDPAVFALPPPPGVRVVDLPPPSP